MRIPVLSDLIDLLLPVECAACGRILNADPDSDIDSDADSDPPLCALCRSALAEKRLPDGVVIVEGVAVVAPYEYSFPLDSAILRAKSQGIRSVFDQFAGPMCEALALAGLSGYPQIVVPVPLHSSRLRQRGYDQACYLASMVAARLGLPLARRAIRRVRATPPQKWAGRQERLAALDEAFAPGRQGEVVKKKRVLLVDDVVTTGATLAAAAQALYLVRPAGILGLTAARTLLSKSRY